MIHILKAFLLVSCVFVGFNIYASKSTYQYAHWVKAHSNTKAHWSGNPNSNVHCKNNVCHHEYRIKWGY